MQAPLTNAPLFSSAGGFSNTFPRPDYQDDVISKYFETAKPSFPSYNGGDNVGAHGGVYNKAGRGFPDVSANGAELEMYYQGQITHFYGTSLAAPIWGSIITLVNSNLFHSASCGLSC
jgi:tripeptidyl-peptidase-1